MRNPFKWARVGYITGRVSFDKGRRHYTGVTILYAREPFLWFKTRKVKQTDSHDVIKGSNTGSQTFRDYQLRVEMWLNGFDIDYISDNYIETDILFPKIDTGK